MVNPYIGFLKRIAHFQVKHPFFVIGVIFFATLIMLSGASQVRTVASLEKMMPSDVEEISAFNTLRDNNLGQDVIAIVVEVNKESSDFNGVVDIRDERVVDYVSYLSEFLESEPDIRKVYSFADFLEEGREEEVFSDPRVKDFVNDDYTITVVMAVSDIAADDDRMNLLSRKIKTDIESLGHPSGVKIRLTGTPVIQQRLGELISNDRINTQWISTALVFIIVLIIFGKFSSAFVPILVVTTTVNWLYGVMGFVGLPISTLAGGVAAMVIGIGIDFAIHIMNKYKYERKKGCGIGDSVEMAVVDTGIALTATSVTTIAAFLAFLFGVMPEMGRFGMLMAIGIGFSLLFSLFGLPALLVLEERMNNYLEKKFGGNKK